MLRRLNDWGQRLTEANEDTRRRWAGLPSKAQEDRLGAIREAVRQVNYAPPPEPVHPRLFFVERAQDRYLGEYFWNGLRNEFPQLNEQTRIAFTTWHEVFVPEVQPRHILEPLEEDRPGLRGWLWRLAGKAFDEPRWTRRGVRIKPVPRVGERKLDLRAFGVSDGREQYYEYLAYDALNDTLWVMKR